MDGHNLSQRSFTTNARDIFYSKPFWRIALVVIAILLGLNLLRHDYLQGYGSDEADITLKEVADRAPPPNGTDWSQFAYFQYVTNEAYLCNSLMIFESLHRLGAQADFLLLYPYQYTVGERTNTGRLLTKARDDYGVTLVPIELINLTGENTWADSFTKLLAFNQTQYKRILALDSDSTILQHMDELFDLPSAPVAVPRAYWLEDTNKLSSQVMLIEPSHFEFTRIQSSFEARQETDYDMEIINSLYQSSCFILPHRNYDLVTGEFRRQPNDHWRYLGSQQEIWDPDQVLREAKFMHFSDWPMPKPWVPTNPMETEHIQPECWEGGKDCRDREVWLWIYKDFQERRERVCGKGFWGW